MAKRLPVIDSFDLKPGRVIAGKYVVDSLLGAGWEGEVYKVIEQKTDIPRAAKVFFPNRNTRDRAVKFYARKLNRLRKCPIIIQYHHSETFQFRRASITSLISEFVEGELLMNFVARQRGKRVGTYEALHLLYAMARGVEQLHRLREYHGDIHDENVLVERRGIDFEVKLVDLYHWGATSAAALREDVIQLIRILYDMVGGAKHYAAQPPEIKRICCGLQRNRISRRFPTAKHLREHLESFQWTSS